MNVSDAISAVRGQARHRGYDPSRISADTALRILDDWARQKPNTAISRWYQAASERTILRFEKHWRRWQKGRSGEAVDRVRPYYWAIPEKVRKRFRYTRKRSAIAAVREMRSDHPEYGRITLYLGDQDDPDTDSDPIYQTS